MESHTSALAGQANWRIASMTVEQVAKALEQREAILIDVREPGERAQHGVIPGAVPAPWGMLVFWEALAAAHSRAKGDPNGRVVLYCATGGRSGLAADTLQRIDYARVTHLTGGFAAWQAGGNPVVDVPPA